MTQVSKNVLYSNRDNDTLDEMFRECFSTQAITTLANIVSVDSFFLETIAPKFMKLTKESLSKIKPLLPLKQDKRQFFFYHLISGGGGSIFKYRDLIFKMTPKLHEISSDKDIAEIAVPKYLKKLLSLNCYNQISEFLAIPIYVRYGNFSMELIALSNLHRLAILTIAYTILSSDGKPINKNSLTNKASSLTHEEKTVLDKESHINIFLLSYYLGVKIIILNNLFSFNVIPNSSKLFGYLTISEPAIMSANKLSVHTLMEYFKDTKLVYNTLLENLSLQMIFQILIFYHVLLKMKPSFVHRDLKLDNILVKELPSHRLSQLITIDDEQWMMSINSPLTFLINDFEKSEIESSKSWIDDLGFFFFSLKHYKNLVLPKKLYTLLDKDDEAYSGPITYDGLGKLIKDDIFKIFLIKE